MGVPENRKERVLAALREDIRRNNGHLDTGIFGTQFFFEVLSENDMHDQAYEAMKKTTQPSYGWWIAQGQPLPGSSGTATTPATIPCSEGESYGSTAGWLA